LTTAIAAGTAGLLLWLATQVGEQTTLRFWASLGIVAGAGLVFAVAQSIGGWTKGLRLRLSQGTFLLGFVPALVVVGWILMATQPGNGWHGGRFASWSSSIGVLNVVHDLSLWHGVLAFGLGIVLGLSLDTVPAVVDVPVIVDKPAAAATAEPVPTDRWAADEPLAAERDAALTAEPHTVVVGPSHEDLDHEDSSHDE
jgi:hypothetical protein